MSFYDVHFRYIFNIDVLSIFVNKTESRVPRYEVTKALKICFSPIRCIFAVFRNKSVSD